MLGVVLLGATARAGGARILDASLGDPSFSTPQSAIDHAPEGAVILVGSGDYDQLSITAKSVSVFAVPGATVNFVYMSISNLAASQTVILSGVHVQSGLSVSNCAGWVRCEASTFRAYDYDWGACDFNGQVIHPGLPAAVVTASPRVVFRACSMTGGRGESTYGDSWLGACVCEQPDSDGGAGLEVHGATSRVGLFDCSLTGGAGGSAEGCQGRGGDGLWTEGPAFLSGCILQGGNGGADIFQPPQCGGPGGDGARSTATLRVLGSWAAGGAAGYPPTCSPQGVPYLGSLVVLPGVAASASFAQVVLSDLRDLPIAYQGGRFDQVMLAYGLKSPLALAFGIRGPILVKDDPFVPLFELGTADGSGALQSALAMPDVANAAGYLRPFVQVLSSGPYGRTLGSPASLVLLDRAAGPDCDGDGLNDVVEVIELPSRDANHNLVPDSCPGG